MEKTDNWAAFGSEYLKAIEVVSKDDEYVIVGVDSREEEKNGKKTNVLHLKLQRDELEKLFGCNKTNLSTIQAECPNSPKDAIGRIVTFNKSKVNNPATGALVDGLRIVFKPTEEGEPTEVNTEEVGLDEEGLM